MGQDSEWIFASVINFLQSPLWSTPVFNFVDQNCIFFGKEEENKLEYTSVHAAYEKLVEQLISQHVISELNISEEQFVAACQEESGNAYAKILFDQVLAGDDFITFKKMMFRRNLALETEALALIQAKEQEKRLKNKMPELKDVGTPEQQIEAAIKLSKESYETESKRKNEQNYAVDDEFNKAVQKSLKEQSDLDTILNKEKDDLEKAIALSIAAAKDHEHSSMKEEERQRIFEMQQSLLRKQTATDDKQQEVLLELQRQRLLDEDKNTAASSAVDRLFARRKMLHQREDFITSDMGDDEKHSMQQQILAERAKLLEQSNKDRDTALKQYLETN